MDDSVSRTVPQIVLEGKPLSAPTRHLWVCLVCEHPFAAQSETALRAAFDDHAAFIAQTRDRAVDPHFAGLRADRLLAD